MILFIERPGAVEFEFGTLQAQSRAGLLPSTWLPLISNPAFKISPYFTSLHLGDPNLGDPDLKNVVIISDDSNYCFFMRDLVHK